jgi:uncharacterized membrane protein
MPYSLTGLTRWVGWNTFLAVIPVVMALGMVKFGRVGGGKWRFISRVAAVACGVVWFAFLPNSCYLLTEWRHFLHVLGYSDMLREWNSNTSSAFALMLHTLFYLFYSGIGALTFTLSIRPVAKMLKLKGLMLWSAGIPFFLMMSTGVYLGLVLRFNSWDLVHRPGSVWASIMSIGTNPRLVTLVLFFGAVLWLIYLITDIWLDGLFLRVRRHAKSAD